MKLTKAQHELLKSVAAGDEQVSDDYAPAKKLASLGLCTWNTGRFSSTWLTITDAGRKILEDAK